MKKWKVKKQKYHGFTYHWQDYFLFSLLLINITEIRKIRWCCDKSDRTLEISCFWGSRKIHVNRRTVIDMAFFKGDFKRAYVSKIAYTHPVYSNNSRCKREDNHNWNGFPDDNMIKSRYKGKNVTYRAGRWLIRIGKCRSHSWRAPILCIFRLFKEKLSWTGCRVDGIIFLKSYSGRAFLRVYRRKFSLYARLRLSR